MTRLLVGFIAIFISIQAFALHSVQFDAGKDSYHLGFLGTYFDGEYGALALSPDIIFKPGGDSIFAPGAYWYMQPDNLILQELSLGMRAYFAEFDNQGQDQNVDAVAFGALARSQVLSLNWPFYLVAGIHYAPDALSYGDAESLFAVMVNLEYELLQQFFVYAGYRNIAVETTSDNDVHIEDTPYLGLRYQF